MTFFEGMTKAGRIRLEAQALEWSLHGEPTLWQVRLVAPCQEAGFPITVQEEASSLETALERAVASWKQVAARRTIHEEDHHEA